MDGIRRYAGIDRAKASHAVCIIDERGSAVARFEVAHSAAGLRELVRRVRDVAGVAIERPDGPVVEALLEAGLPVVVIASRHVKALRARHGLAGNKDDRADAYILADALRTDGQRLRLLCPDAPATVALRAAVRARKDRPPGALRQPPARRACPRRRRLGRRLPRVGRGLGAGDWRVR